MMKNLDIELLKTICETPGAPGFEKRIRDFVINTITPLVDEFSVDNMGNLVAVKRAVKGQVSEKKVMVAAHLDEIGFIVTHIDDQGFLRFHTLGGFDPKTLTAQRVIVHGKKDLVGVMGSKPIHVMSVEERATLPKTTDFFIDLGMSKKEVEEIVSVGDAVTRQRELIEMGNCVNCKSIDNRISVYILIEVLKGIHFFPYDFYAVFTVQEEMGARGAVLASHSVNPDFAIALDTTIAYDVPGAKPQEMITQLGKGAAIKLIDSSVISDRRLVAYLKQTATENNITWQTEILTGGNTDAGPMQRSGKLGAIAGAISIPTRHIHQVIEMADKGDIIAVIDLLEKAVSGLDKFDWAH